MRNEKVIEMKEKLNTIVGLQIRRYDGEIVSDDETHVAVAGWLESVGTNTRELGRVQKEGKKKLKQLKGKNSTVDVSDPQAVYSELGQKGLTALFKSMMPAEVLGAIWGLRERDDEAFKESVNTPVYEINWEELKEVCGKELVGLYRSSRLDYLATIKYEDDPESPFAKLRQEVMIWARDNKGSEYINVKAYAEEMGGSGVLVDIAILEKAVKRGDLEVTREELSIVAGIRLGQVERMVAESGTERNVWHKETVESYIGQMRINEKIDMALVDRYRQIGIFGTCWAADDVLCDFNYYVDDINRDPETVKRGYNYYFGFVRQET